MGVKNLGQVASLKVDASAPTNTKMLWYDTTVNYLKYYDPNTLTWRAVASTVVGASTLCLHQANVSIAIGNNNVAHPSGTVVGATVVNKDNKEFIPVDLKRDTLINTIVSSTVAINNAEVNIFIIL